MTDTQPRKLDVTIQGDAGIVLTRSFDAPRHLVWDVMTKPEHVVRWWGRRTWTMPVCDIDLRVGGTYRYVHLGPDGATFAFHGEYREIEAPARLVHTEVFDMDPDAHGADLSKCTEPAALNVHLFEEVDGRTNYTCTSTYPTQEIRDAVIATGMEDGAAESFDRIDELLPEFRP